MKPAITQDQRLTWRAVGWSLSLLLPAARLSAQAQGSTPADAFDLSHWSLTLPDQARAWLATVTDITNQKAVEAALHDREQRLNLRMGDFRGGGGHACRLSSHVRLVPVYHDATDGFDPGRQPLEVHHRA